MRTSGFLAAAALASQAAAHYVFPALIVNGEVTTQYEFVREAKNSNSPVTDVTSPDIVCNKGGNDADVLAKTKTQAVKAGDELGFTVETSISHPGPLAVYMSKAPSSVADYKGDGDWFKIYELTTSSITAAGLQWATTIDGAGIQNLTFAIPKELPTGEYLLRVEHVALHSAEAKGGAQFYISCAQLSVTGAASGTPKPTVKFPGAYTGTEPGLMINIYYPIPTSYTPAGPATWPNACEDHTTNLLGKTSDGDCTGSTPSPAGPSAPAPSAGIPDYNGGNSTATPTPASSSDDCGGSSSRRHARSMRRRLARAAY